MTGEDDLQRAMTGPRTPLQAEGDSEGGRARCAYCKFWCPSHPEGEMGECRRYAPRAGDIVNDEYFRRQDNDDQSYAVWPETYETRICGDFVWGDAITIQLRSRGAVA